MELEGLEPPTSSVQRRRSPSELQPLLFLSRRLSGLLGRGLLSVSSTVLTHLYITSFWEKLLYYSRQPQGKTTIEFIPARQGVLRSVALL